MIWLRRSVGLGREERRDLKKIDRQWKAGFRDLSLLQTALTHKSFSNESGDAATVSDNERLEFLGDAVLDLVVAEFLMSEFPDDPEGKLSQRRSALVSEKALAQMALHLEIGKVLRLGKGERQNGGAQKPSLLANALEAVIGALFVDRGYRQASAFVRRQLAHRSAEHDDFKSKLQEMVQQRFRVTPRYVLMGQSGPDHDRTFEVALRVREEIFGIGRGRSKKEAEQDAAAKAISRLNAEPR